MTIGVFAVVADVADNNDPPGEQDVGCADRGDDRESRQQRIARIEQRDRGEEEHRGEEHRVPWNRACRPFAQLFGGLTVLGQTECHAAGRVDTRIRAGCRRGQHHQVDGECRPRKPDHGEHRGEGAFSWVDLVPRGHCHDDGKCANIEHEDANHDRVDGPGQVAVRVACFCRGGADELDPDKGEDAQLEAENESAETGGEESAVFPKVGKVGLGACRAGEPGEDKNETDNNEAKDGNDLDDGEPELGLTKGPYRLQVQDQQGHSGDHRGDPDGDAGVEVLHVRGDRDDVGHTGDDPGEPVVPRDKEAGPRADEILGDVAKVLVVQVGQQQLTQGAHDKEQHEANDHVDKDHRRPNQADDLP